MDDDTKADAPLTPDEERALREDAAPQSSCTEGATMRTITQYMEGRDGTRLVSLGRGTCTVTVTPRSREDNQTALRLAQTLAVLLDAADRESTEQSHLEMRIAALAEDNKRLRAELEAERDRIQVMLTGRRHFFTEVVMVPSGAGWRGEVALLDPAKLWRGRALLYACVDDVRRAHPELWVRGTTDVGDRTGVVLDGWAEP